MQEKGNGKIIKQKVRMVPISVKLLISVAIMFILGNVSLSYNAIITYNDEYRDLAITKAEVASGVAVTILDAESVVKVIEAGEESELYVTIAKQLTELAKITGVKYVYTVHEIDGKYCYGVDIDNSEDKASIGDEFDYDHDLLDIAFDGEVAKTTTIQEVEGDYLLTVYEPIKDNDGNVVAVLASDYDAEHLITARYAVIQKMLIIISFTLAFDLFVLYIIIKSIVKNIVKVNSKLFEIVNNEGDLTDKLDIKSGDEAELISENVNKLLEYIRTIMLNIRDNSQQLSESVKVVTGKVKVSEEGLSDASATMEEMSAAMEETSASLNHINTIIADTLETVQEVAKFAKESEDKSYHVVTKASKIRDAANEEQTKAKGLANELTKEVEERLEKSKSVSQISQLTDEILNIASQTNLLALNASIEAARAGEAGRGFSVVATEIGKLANTSADAANEIRVVSEEVIEAVEQLAEYTNKILEFLDNVAMKGYDNLMTTSEDYKNDVANMGEIMAKFCTSAEHIETAMDSVRESMDAINVAIEESTIGITNITSTTVDLTSDMSDIQQEMITNDTVAESLIGEVSKFKLD